MSTAHVDTLATALRGVPDGHGCAVPISTPAANAIASWVMRLLADAWDEGYAEAINRYGTDIPWGGMTTDDNPYRLALGGAK